MKQNKAFCVSSENADGGMIVFATTAGRAKAMAMHEDLFDACEFIELSARRLKDADKFSTTERCLTMYTKEEQETYRHLGWHEYEAATCDGCGEYEFSLLPDTHLDGDGYCPQCREEQAQ